MNIDLSTMKKIYRNGFKFINFSNKNIIFYSKKLIVSPFFKKFCSKTFLKITSIFILETSKSVVVRILKTCLKLFEKLF